MSKSNNKKSELVGMAIATASARLKKSIMFSLVVRLKENICYRCGSEILSEEDLTVEHKEAWMQAEDPVQSFFDLDNIAFSHLSCNAAAASRPTKKWCNDAERKRAKWHSLTKDRQQEIRRDNYHKYGC